MVVFVTAIDRIKLNRALWNIVAIKKRVEKAQIRAELFFFLLQVFFQAFYIKVEVKWQVSPLTLRCVWRGLSSRRWSCEHAMRL